MSLAQFENEMTERLQRIETMLERVLDRNAQLESMVQSHEPEHCLVSDVSQYADCKPQSIYNWRCEYKRRNGEEIPFIEYVGGRDRVNIVKLRQFIEERKQQRKKPNKSKVTPIRAIANWRMKQAQRS